MSIRVKPHHEVTPAKLASIITPILLNNRAINKHDRQPEAPAGSSWLRWANMGVQDGDKPLD